MISSTTTATTANTQTTKVNSRSSSSSNIKIDDEQSSLFEPLPLTSSLTGGTTDDAAELLLRVLSPSPDSSPNRPQHIQQQQLKHNSDDSIEMIASSDDWNKNNNNSNMYCYHYPSNFGKSNASIDCQSSLWNHYDTIPPIVSSTSDNENKEYYSTTNTNTERHTNNGSYIHDVVRHHDAYSSPQPCTFSPINAVSSSSHHTHPPVPSYAEHWQRHWQNMQPNTRMVVDSNPQNHFYHRSYYPSSSAYCNSSSKYETYQTNSTTSTVCTKKASSYRRGPRITVYPRQFGPIQYPSDNDVLSGRGGRINCHVGNQQFRTMVAQVRTRYLNPHVKKLEKAHIAAEIVYEIRYRLGGYFLVEDEHQQGMLWYDIGDKRAIRKVAQALRENIPPNSGVHKSSSSDSCGSVHSDNNNNTNDDNRNDCCATANDKEKDHTDKDDHPNLDNTMAMISNSKMDWSNDQDDENEDEDDDDDDDNYSLSSQLSIISTTSSNTMDL